MALAINSRALASNSMAVASNSMALASNSMALFSNSMALFSNSMALVSNSMALFSNSMALFSNSMALVSNSMHRKGQQEQVIPAAAREKPRMKVPIQYRANLVTWCHRANPPDSIKYNSETSGKLHALR